jgi:hypothetical protein
LNIGSSVVFPQPTVENSTHNTTNNKHNPLAPLSFGRALLGNEEDFILIYMLYGGREGGREEGGREGGREGG